MDELMINGLILSTQPHFWDTGMKTVLLENPPPDQKEWRFVIPSDQLQQRRPTKTSGKIYGKRITFTAVAITLEIGELSNNRILQDDDPSKFVAVSFGGLRFPDSFLRVTADYIQRFMEAGLYLNGTQYRFYHHSNSQLVGLYSHDPHAELSRRCDRENAVASCAPQIRTPNWIDVSISWESLKKLITLQNVGRSDERPTPLLTRL